jgi:hypothetical protein
MPNRPGARSRSSVGRRGSKVHGEVRLPRLRLPHKAAEKLAAGPAWREHGYIFPTRVGSHSTFYAVLNVHPRVAQMSMGHGSFSTTMKFMLRSSFLAPDAAFRSLLHSDRHDRPREERQRSHTAYGPRDPQRIRDDPG